MSDKLKEVQDRLASAKRAREQAETAAADAMQIARLTAEAEAEERAVKEAAILGKLVEEHGPIGVKIKARRTAEGMFVVKRPNHLIFRRYVDTGKTSCVELEKLVKSALVYPTFSEFEAICEQQPGALLLAASDATDLAGVGSAELTGK